MCDPLPVLSITVRRPARIAWTNGVPGSKSLTNRALLLAALARNSSELLGWLDADDTQHMRACLEALGVRCHVEAGGELRVQGCAGRFPVSSPVDLYVGTAGTVARFLVAALGGHPGQTVVDGSPRMRERPMATLIDALRRQGAAIACLEREGHLPLKLGPHAAALRGGDLRLERPASSQFVSALVFAGCLAASPLTIVLEQGSPARPYIDMTLATVRAFGGDARWLDDASIRVTPSTLTGRRFAIEPDASAATYPLALAAIYGGTTTIEGLGTDSLQGDAHFAGILERFGARVEQTSTRTTVHGTGFLTSQSVDLGEMPDTALTVAVLALFARGPTRITGVEVLRHHESDRIAAAATELRKLGATVVEHHDGLTIEPPSVLPIEPVAIDTYDDHRMAMAFSLAGHVTIMDPMCVRKTFPTYFEELTKHGMVHGWT